MAEYEENIISTNDMRFFCIPSKIYEKFELKENICRHLIKAIIINILLELWNIYILRNSIQLEIAKILGLSFRLLQITFSLILYAAQYTNNFRMAYWGVQLIKGNYVLLFIYSIIHLFIFTVIAYYLNPFAILIIYLYVVFYSMISLYCIFVMQTFARCLGKKNWTKLGGVVATNLEKTDNETNKNETYDGNLMNTTTNSTHETGEKIQELPIYQEIKMVSLDV